MKTIFKLIGFFVTSIGFFWSHLDLIRIYFSCKLKDDIFPEYFAAFPFIYKSQSLATSMANEYYLLGILLNSIITTTLFLFIDSILSNFLKSKGLILSKLYFTSKLLILSFSVFNIYILYTFLSDDNFRFRSDFREKVKEFNADCKLKIKVL